ncbi:hypothetical protein FA15DRAFT_711607 [Coprinopsis marcescibilis]|uniref:Uncharacterized protein n=1 Tax=Coprinopsis marcescibilis TaxID=230819 RepID=A0A5C3K984_COPMA|nr:hypothetical protein FA15DRAFT_711607 [Coprinopsis marcescibilis]
MQVAPTSVPNPIFEYNDPAPPGVPVVAGDPVIVGGFRSMLCSVSDLDVGKPTGPGPEGLEGLEGLPLAVIEPDSAVEADPKFHISSTTQINNLLTNRYYAGRAPQQINSSIPPDTTASLSLQVPKTQSTTLVKNPGTAASGHRQLESLFTHLHCAVWDLHGLRNDEREVEEHRDEADAQQHYVLGEAAKGLGQIK